MSDIHPRHSDSNEMPPPHSDVQSAIESLSSARWTGEPDWPRFKEKLMSTSRRRFGAVQRRPFFFGAIALLTLGGAAAATHKVRDVLRFEGVMIEDELVSVVYFDGETIHDTAGVLVISDMVIDADGVPTITISMPELVDPE